jgi:hypothetical protein
MTLDGSEGSFDARQAMERVFRLRPDAEYFRHVGATARHRGATEIQFGLTGGKGFEAMPNYRLTDREANRSRDFNGRNHQPYTGLDFGAEHLSEPFTLEQVRRLEACANERERG